MILNTGWFVTRDEHRADGHFPLPPYEYCFIVLDRFHTKRRLIIPKSRQVLISWLVAAYLVAMSLLAKNELNVYQTKREEDAIEFMERIYFLYNHLPEWIQKIRPKQSPPKENKMKLELPGFDTKILGVPSGGDVVRGKTMTRYVSDECNFQPEAKASLRAAAPATGLTGKMYFISTANAGGLHEGLIRGDW